MNKVRVIFYILKQWLSNVRHNKFMIFASVCVITISLFLLGILFMISENIQYMLDNMSDKPEIIVFCNKDLSDEDCVVIKDKITSDSRVDSVTTISREENFQNLLDYFKDYDSEDLFKGREDVSWVSFTVKLKDSQTASGFVSDMKNVGGVDDVEYSAELVSFFAGAKNITNMGIIIAFVILGLISIVLVYNTIKLTVLSRKKELEIMKYIGASNSYIRGPFYLEGIFIGII
ncbi:MAG: ABC transporter permease, partial [Clostridiales bacterium]|nr:ABC transporter permease [Clostridiales bacterium]